jgi:hypothetical protein
VAAGTLALCAAAGFAATAAPAAYERMAPLDEYLIAKGTEVALARSAAPAEISDKATVLTLGRKGYENAVNGSNGFTCLVERSWMSPFDSPEFWNPKMRGPVCYNPAASKSILAYTLHRTKLVLDGRSKREMLEEIRAALERKELPWPAPGAMSFMMSKDGYLGDDAGGPWHPHVMFFTPPIPTAAWGANLPGTRVYGTDAAAGDPYTTFYVPLAAWSDGTPDAATGGHHAM